MKLILAFLVISVIIALGLSKYFVAFFLTGILITLFAFGIVVGNLVEAFIKEEDEND